MARMHRGNNAKAVIVIQQEDGSYIAYRVRPMQLDIDNDYPETSWDTYTLPSRPYRTRITLEGELIDGFAMGATHRVLRRQTRTSGRSPRARAVSRRRLGYTHWQRQQQQKGTR